MLKQVDILADGSNGASPCVERVPRPVPVCTSTAHHWWCAPTRPYPNHHRAEGSRGLPERPPARRTRYHQPAA
eukprot:2150585-Prymnesium_polylepis.1